MSQIEAIVVLVAMAITGALTASITEHLVTQRMEIQIVGNGCGTYTEEGEFMWVKHHD